MRKIVFKNKKEVEYLKTLYENGLSVRQIAKKYGCCYASIHEQLTKCGCKFRKYGEHLIKYYQDDHYFDQIDTEDKAYFFGLLYADGCNVFKKNTIQITLAEYDKYILESFKLFIRSNRKFIFLNKKKPNYANQIKMTICSKHMCEILNDYGMVPRKTFIKKFPSVIFNSDETTIRHFVRGYHDGNGNVNIEIGESKLYLENNLVSGVKFQIVSTKNMCCAMGYIFYKYCNVKCNLGKMKNSFTISCSKKEDTYKILTWLYKDSTIYLTRKHDKYILLENTLKFKNLI